MRTSDIVDKLILKKKSAFIENNFKYCRNDKGVMLSSIGCLLLALSIGKRLCICVNFGHEILAQT